MSAMVELVLTLRGEEAGLCLVFVGSLLISRSVRDLRVCSVELMIKTGARSCHITDQRLGCHRAVLFSRQCSQRLQASDVERGRNSEAKRLHSGRFSCKTHISHCFHAILHTVSSHPANDLHAVLCRAVCVSVPLVASMMLIASHVTCKLRGFLSFHQFSWLVVLLTRCVGKQTSSGPTSPFLAARAAR